MCRCSVLHHKRKIKPVAVRGIKWNNAGKNGNSKKCWLNKEASGLSWSPCGRPKVTKKADVATPLISQRYHGHNNAAPVSALCQEGVNLVCEKGRSNCP